MPIENVSKARHSTRQNYEPYAPLNPSFKNKAGILPLDDGPPCAYLWGVYKVLS